jgi:hypothetical protein
VALYLKEARTAVNLISKKPPHSVIVEKKELLKDLAAKLPEAPTSVDHRDELEKQLQLISRLYLLIELEYDNEKKYLDLGDESLAARARKFYTNQSAEIQTIADSVEKQLGLRASAP